MTTLGTLIDELTIVNLKIWHLEDIKRNDVATDTEIATATRKTNILNPQRNNLIEEIDNLMIDYINKTKIPNNSYAGSTKLYTQTNNN